MKPIPLGESSIAIRTDFTDEAAWQAVCAQIVEPVGEHQFRAYVDFVSDPEYDGLTVTELCSLFPAQLRPFYFFVIDRSTLADPEHPVLVIKSNDDSPLTFRVIPAEMWAVENNLWTGNMSFSEFADEVDEDGVYRGIDA